MSFVSPAMGLLVAALAVCGESHPALPPRWASLTEALALEPSELAAQSLPAHQMIVDSTGRYLYDSLDGRWGVVDQRDFQTRAIREAVVGVSTSGDAYESSEVDRYKARWVRSRAVGESDAGVVCQLIGAKGGTIAAYVIAGKRLGRKNFVAEIGGPPAITDGRKELRALLELGVDVVTFGGRELRRVTNSMPTDPRLRFERDVIKILHGSRIRAVRIPNSIAIRGTCVWPITNCSFWAKSTVYMLNPNRFGPGGYQIAYSGNSARIREFPPLSGQPVGWLADQSLCKVRMGDKTGEVDCEIFDTRDWKWHYYPGLAILAVSFDGRYVAYFWHGENTIHLARVGG